MLAALTACGGGSSGDAGSGHEELGQGIRRSVDTGAPVVSYTDALSGPVSGGENGQGAYLSIFGKNFGDASGLGSTTRVFIGNAEVASYRSLGPSAVSARLGFQQLVVQVGALGGQPLGSVLPVKVVVNGVASNTDATFVPNAGRILFVSRSGNDSTAVPGDITHPFRHLQHPADYTGSDKSVAEVMQAGDHIVIRGGDWNDLGGDTAWFRFRYPNQEGSAPTAHGDAGHGWIHFTAYPTETVHYSTPAGAKGGIQGANSVYFKTTGDYISISNLHFDVSGQASSDAAPINVQYSAGPWRAVNNEIGPWPATQQALAGGISGHGKGDAFYGNNIHDIASGGDLENHGIYADSGASDWDIGYNWIHAIPGGNGVQFYDNVGLAAGDQANMPKNWPGFTGMKVHHNVIDGAGKYGLNMADGIVSGKVWNNVVTGSAYSGLRINTISKNMNMTFAFNTFYDNDQLPSGSGNAQVLNTWGNYDPTGTISIVDNLFAAGPHTLASSAAYADTGGYDAYISLSRNLWWSADGRGGDRWAGLKRDARGVFLDPLFTAAATGDLTLQAGSPAIDAATAKPGFAVPNDLTVLGHRPAGAANDLGAYERQ